MARKPKQKPQAEPVKSNFDEFADEAETSEDDVPTVDAAALAAAAKLRDWRDVERYREERLLKRLINDDIDLDDLLENKPRRRR